MKTLSQKMAAKKPVQQVTIREVFEMTRKQMNEGKYNDTLKNLKIIGIVIRASRVSQLQTHKDFTRDIDIIDDTFNHLNSASPKFLQICIQTKQQEDNAPLNQIGDIVVLKRYEPSIIGKEFVCYKQRTNPQTSSYFVYEFKPQNPQSPFKMIYNDKSRQQKKNNNEEQKRIQELREWLKKIINETSIFAINIYGVQSTHKQNEYKLAPFNMLLRLKKRYEKSDSTYQLEFIDGSNEIYYLEIPRSELAFNQFDLIHIDDIERIDQNRSIILSEKGHLMMLPYECLDQKIFDQVIYTPILPPDEDINDYGKENDGDYEQNGNPKLLTQIKKECRSLKQYSCYELIEIQKHFENTKQQIPFKKCRALVYVVNIDPPQLSNAMKSICKFCRQSYSWDVESFQCCQRDTIPAMQCLIAMKDLSIDTLKDYFEAYIFTYDNNSSTFFPGIDASKIHRENITQFQEIYFQSLEKICEIGDLETVYELVLEPMTFQNKMIWRIIDTMVKPKILKMNLLDINKTT